MKNKNIFAKIWFSSKESVRKFIVTLKRNPHYIPLVSLLVAFVILSFHLTDISNTTAYLNKMGMGLCAFISMLFSILSMVCMLNAFPKRQKPKIFMIILMLVLFSAVIVADVLYHNNIVNTIYATDSPIVITVKNYFVIDAQYAMIYHIIAMVITAVLVIFEPLIAKLLSLIKTSVEVENNEGVGAIDVSQEE